MGFKHVAFLLADSSTKPHSSDDAECGRAGASSTTPSKTRAGMWCARRLPPAALHASQRRACRMAAPASKQACMHTPPRISTLPRCRGRSSPRGRAAPGHPTALALGLTTAVILCCYLLLAGRSDFGGSLPGLGRQGLRRYGDGTAHTLVIYVYAHTGGWVLPLPLLLLHTSEACRSLERPAPLDAAAGRSPPMRCHAPGLPSSAVSADPEYEGNLRFFLEAGVVPDDGCDYLLIVQEAS